jgi:5-methylcytosine-specific restriction endonuclease McrA
MTQKQRKQIFDKYDGKCAYSGTPLESDWQADHIKPIIRNWINGKARFENDDNLDNIVPCQKIINHYKHQLSLHDFRNWYLKDLHIRLAKLPKNPRTEKSRKKNEYMRKVASYFGITENIPFSGVFYFETL